MYLFSIEGGDGSGKGLAAEIVSEILESEFCFTSVETTAEPRREHALGRLAIDSVKKQTILACLKKVFKSASDVDALLVSAHDKLDEFLALGYPRTLLRKFCCVMARDTQERVWFDIRDQMS